MERLLNEFANRLAIIGVSDPEVRAAILLEGLREFAIDPDYAGFSSEIEDMLIDMAEGLRQSAA